MKGSDRHQTAETRMVRVVSAHEIPSRAPLLVSPGEKVVAHRRDTTWPEFVFVTAAHGEGWVPARHLAADLGPTTALVEYDTTELATAAGEILLMLTDDETSGWMWCRNERGREGWVPSSSVEPMD